LVDQLLTIYLFNKNNEQKNCNFWRNYASLGHSRLRTFQQATQFNATFGGGEANVAVSLSNYGMDAEFVTRLPKNDIAEFVHHEFTEIWRWHKKHFTGWRPSRYLFS